MTPNIYNKLAEAYDLIRRESGGDLESQGASLLLHIMTHDPDPLLVKELMLMVDVTHGSIIRYLRLLGSDDDHPRGGECAGLVQCVIDPTDKRRKLVTLSAKGRRLKAKISEILFGEYY